MKSWYSKDFKVGVLGGGQLGRMLMQEAVNYDIKLCMMDKDPSAPCSRFSHEFTNNDILDYEAVLEFGKDKDVITVEIENVNIEAYEELERQGKKVFPQPSVLKTVRDKGVQKNFFKENNLPTPPYYLVENKAEISKYEQEFPFMQKMRVGGYDGRGVQALKTLSDLDKAFDAPSVLEKFVDFEKEISVIVARNENGEISHFPVVECQFNPEVNLVEFLFSPAQISEAIEEDAISIARRTIEALGMVGLLAVEMFVTKDGRVLINEIAPRPHNSGHHTIECNVTSQYEQHLRAILNLPLGSTKMLRPGVMVNLLGEPGYEGNVKYEGLEDAMKIPGVKAHIYGKAQTKPYRKMGHVTATAPLLQEAVDKARKVQEIVKVKA
ncbi:5-(carboxyamino)imidazole ribonucleotide synthase [Wandonia haliotis]|uniref:N5-carboxyaminoimidazole ribonucleotide synthase n=1 Tax=Wandonia haliotis TaxID=574963 RepID=A0ABN1MMG2_9FLAO